MQISCDRRSIANSATAQETRKLLEEPSHVLPHKRSHPLLVRHRKTFELCLSSSTSMAGTSASSLPPNSPSQTHDTSRQNKILHPGTSMAYFWRGCWRVDDACGI